MDLWIRSQDKMKLTRVIDIGIFEEQEGYTIYYDDSIDNMLGTYETKTRALEVLDHIQFLIEQTGELTEKIIEYIRKLLKDEKWNINSTSNTATYEMPER